MNRLYNYCNILLGDPIIRFAFPDKPNFVVNENSVKFSSEFVSDNQDSIDVKLILANWGRVINDSLEVEIEGIYADTTIYLKNLVLQSPFYKDSLDLRIPVFGLAGEHRIKVELDNNNLIDEVTKTDNSIDIHFIVYSTKIRPIEEEYFYNTSRSSAEILNPTISFNNQINEIELAISQDPDFVSQQLFTRQFDSVATKFTLNNLLPNNRYYWRARLKNSEQEWSQTVSFFND